MKKIYIIFMTAIMCFMLSCSKDQPPPEVTLPESESLIEAPVPQESENEETEPEPVPPEQPETDEVLPEPQFFSELTGLEISEEESKLRPIAVMINNNVNSLPQSGISAADIIFECEAEGGETRMMALFKPYESLGTIGTVRSSRDYFIDFAQIFDALYIHAGGSPQAYEHIKSRKIQNLDGVNMYLPDTFWRDPERLSTSLLEHTMVTSGDKLAAKIKEFGYRTQLKNGYEPSLRFAAEEYIPAGESAEYMKIPRAFASEFKFDFENGTYTHTQYGLVQSDKENSEQLTFKNVIVLFASQSLLGDEKNRISVKFTGEGKGYFLTMGKYIPITWQRDSRDGGIVLTDEMGVMIELNPGKTFISVVNSWYSKKLTFN